ncbi:MAG: DegV family protein [Actinomycetota bacterium]|nr:DegV family protein [Actinomycetota bacterium]MDP9168457.1 DegV family protein [Actinomycetota bacterium]
MAAPGARVAVVTDSTAYLPPGVADELGVRSVPLRVSIDGRDALDPSSHDIVAALVGKQSVTTSRPTPAEFAQVFRECLDAGATRVVSIHLAAALSGTWESAVLAAQDFEHGVVRVVDSRSTAAALGFAVAASAVLAREGATAAQVQGAATDTVDRTRTLFYVDTIEYLRRGGRIGKAASVFATSLSVKPLLQMVEGQIVALEKVRTSSKAIARLVQLTIESAGVGPVDVAVHHLVADERAAQVAAQLRSALPRLGELYVAELGPVIGAHLGPGAIGTVVVRR